MKRRTFSREIGMRLYSFFFFLFFLPFFIEFFLFPRPELFGDSPLPSFPVPSFFLSNAWCARRVGTEFYRVLPSFVFWNFFLGGFLQSSDFPEVPMKLFTEFHCFFSVRLGKRRFLRGFPRGFPRGFSRVPQVPLGL